MDDSQDEATDRGLDRRAVVRLTSVAVAGAAVSTPLGGFAADGPRSPSSLDPILALDATALAHSIRTRQLSCAEVMAATLDHIHRANPAVNAIVAMPQPELLLRQAREHDAVLARGEAVGPLFGLPHAVKDLSPVKGLLFTEGSPIFRDRVATADSLMVERLRQAGVIFIGKTNTPEFGLGSHTYNPVYGVTRNPYDLSRSAGGSSGGAAAALAMRMTPLADGSDYGGSLRNPAGWNNVFGFRTSFGRVPAPAKDVWLPSMSVTGPMARTVADLALLLSVQAGWDARAPLSMESGGAMFRGPLTGDVKGARIGWLGDFGGAVPYDPGVLEVCRAALKTLEGLGCTVEDAAPDHPVEAVWQAFVRLRAWQQGGGLKAYYDDPDQRAMLKPEAVWEVEAGARPSAYDISAASAVRTQWSNAVARLFQRHDYLVLPTAQVFPFPVEQTWPHSVGGHTMATYHEWMKAVCLITMAGCPSLAVPAGLGPEGLPMGLQIVGPVHAEVACLRLAAAYEAADPARAHRAPPGV